EALPDVEAGTLHQAVWKIGGDMLAGIRHFRTDEGGYPAHVEPQHQHWELRQGAVDGVRVGHANLEGDIDPLRNLPQRAAHDPTNQGRDGPYTRIGEKGIEEGENQPQSDVGEGGGQTG